MIEWLNPFVLSERQREDVELAEWAFQSHYWIEEMTGMFVCRWCGAVHYTSTCILTKDYPVCKKNYVVMKLLEENKKEK